MCKRIRSILLAVIILLNVLAVFPAPVSAVEDMVISDLGLEMIKKFEGFIKLPKEDNKQISVGYGTACTEEEARMYEAQGGITEEQATEKLLQFVASKASYVNAFAKKLNITFTQNEFDALVSLTYNIGQSWTTNTQASMYQALAQGDRGAAIAYAFVVYSHSGTTTSQGHIQRRLLELQMFIDGVYDLNKGWPVDHRYVLLDANGGFNRYNPYGFSVSHPTSIEYLEMTPPEGVDEEGNKIVYEFAGWFTQPIGGDQVTVLDETIEHGMILYAHWEDPFTGETVNLEPGEIVDINVKATVNGYMMEGPCRYYNRVRMFRTDELLHIDRIVTGKDQAVYGRTPEGWVKLSDTNYGTIATPPEQPKPGTWATITATSVRVRTAPHLIDTDTGSRLPNGTVVEIVEIQMEGDARKWGKMTNGYWICLEENGSPYASVEVIEEQPETPPTSNAPDISGAITITQVSLNKMPTYLVYGLNGPRRIVNVLGGQLRITYSNGKSYLIELTRAMTSGFDNTKLGTNVITVRVGDATTTFQIQIEEIRLSAISMATQPETTLYLKGNAQLDLTGATLRLEYNLGSTEIIPITSDMVTGFDPHTAGTQELTVTYENLTTGFTVNVVDNDLKSISIHRLPEQLEYQLEREELNLTGAVLSAVYGYEGEKLIPITSEMVSGFDKNVAGTQVITVRFGGLTTSFTVDVVDDRIQGISIHTLPTKLQYLQGTETLDLTGAILAVEYGAGGTSYIPITSDMVTGFDNLTGGEKTLTVSYGGLTTTFAVQIKLHVVEFVNDNGDVISRQEYALGETVIVPQDPSKAADRQGEYAFTGWDKEITICTGSTTYTAQYRLSFQRGDVNHDGDVTDADGIYLLWHIFFPEDYPVYVENDFNGDGVVTDDDGIYLLWHIFFPEDYPLH